MPKACYRTRSRCCIHEDGSGPKARGPTFEIVDRLENGCDVAIRSARHAVRFEHRPPELVILQTHVKCVHIAAFKRPRKWPQVLGGLQIKVGIEVLDWHTNLSVTATFDKASRLRGNAGL